MAAWTSEVDELGGIIHFRSERAALFPVDCRNLEAVALARRLIAELKVLDGPVVQAFDAVWVMLNDSINDDRDISDAWDDYRRSLGFRAFPNTAEEYLATLIKLAEHAAAMAMRRWYQSATGAGAQVH